MQKLKRPTAILVLLATIISLFSASAFAADTISEGGSSTVQLMITRRAALLSNTYGATLNIRYREYKTNTGVTGTAYCLEHGLDDHAGDGYWGTALDIAGEYISNPQAVGALANGFPIVPLAEFLSRHAGGEPQLDGLTEMEYAYATQIALWAATGQVGVEGTPFPLGSIERFANLSDSTDPVKVRVYKCISVILNAAYNCNKIYKPGMSLRLESDAVRDTFFVSSGQYTLKELAAQGDQGIQLETINGSEYVTRTYIAGSATPVSPNGGVIDIWIEGAPTGTICVSMNNQPLSTKWDSDWGGDMFLLPATTKRDTGTNENGFEYYGEFKLAIPADSAGASGNIKIHAHAVAEQYKIYKAAKKINWYQDYVIIDKPETYVYSEGFFKWASEDNPPDPLTCSVEIVKVDGTNNPISGVPFTLSGNGFSSTKTSDASGRITWADLEPGTYTVTEVEAPEGYQLINPVNVTVLGGQSVTQTIRNSTDRTFTLKKVDAQNGGSLAGARFQFTQVDGTHQCIGTTQSDGTIMFIGAELPYGTYVVTEVQAPNGYEPDPLPQTVVWDGTSDVSVLFKNARKPGIKLIKICEDTSETIAGVSFDVYKDGKLITSVTTNQAGQAVVSDVSEGYYEFVETSTVPGYILDPTPKGIHVDPYDPTSADDPVLVVTNKPAPSLRIIKYDEDTMTKLQGAVFEVYRDASLVGTYTTGADGEASLHNLEPGTYFVKEISAPSGYVVMETPQQIEITAGQTAQLIFLNKLKPGIHLVKLDSETMKPLVNATYLIKKIGDTFSKEYVTDENGEINLTGLEPGAYTVEEIIAPNGYLIDNAQRIIQINAGEDARFVFTDTKKPSLEVLKFDGENYLPGATFRIAKIEDGSHYLDRITDENGRIRIDDLEPGIYSITEMQAPPGYVLNDHEYHVELFPGSTSQLVVPNVRKPDLCIIKTDAITGLPIEGVTYTVRKVDSSTVSTVKTDANGEAWLYALDPGVYQVTEQSVPAGFLLDPIPQLVTLEGGRTAYVRFQNDPRPKLQILKVDVVTGKPLPLAEFRVSKVEGNTVSEYITDETGSIIIDNLDEAIYRVEEFMAPSGYIRYDQYKDIELEGGKTKTLKFDNVRKPVLIITKTNALTYEPIPNTTFKIEHEQSDGGVVTLGTYRTDANGQIVIKNAEAGWYIITETVPAPGFSLPSNPVTRKYLAPGENAYTNFSASDQGVAGDTSGDNVMVTSGTDYLIGHEILDYPLNSIVIRKVNAITGELLAGAAFELRQVSEDISGSSGTLIGRYTTDNSGTIVITGLKPGGYIIEEVEAPANYLLSENAQQQVWLKPDGTSIVEATFANFPYGGILITKVDAVTNKPLADARFRVTDSSGAVLGNTNGEYITDENGEIMIPNVKPGSYVVTEIEAPEHYKIDTTPQTIEVGTDGKIYKTSFKNQPDGALIILKKDNKTGEPLSGAQFKVTDSSGALVGNGNGVFTTDKYGSITIFNLPKGTYVVQEIKAPDGYILEAQSQTVAVDSGKTYTLEYFNKAMSGVQIIKIDATTKQPIKGAKFTIYRMDGGIVGSYETNGDGVIILDMLESGWYKAAETKAPDGYILDDTPQDFEITSEQFIKLVFENRLLGGISIIKLDEETRQPLSGVEFEIRKLNGALIGAYRTDSIGQIYIPGLADGWYNVVETKAASGYRLDREPNTIEIRDGEAVQLTITNRKTSSFFIHKIDSVTGKGIYGVSFLVSDENNNPITTVESDQDGYIYLPGLSDGKYFIREIEAAPGYILDTTVKTFYVTYGATTEIEWKNTPQQGQIQILKKSADDNPINGFPAGTLLEGAVFEVYDKAGNTIDTIKTDKNGRAVSGLLPPGRYTVREVTAPPFYSVNTQTAEVDIEFAGQIIRLEFLNKSVFTSVGVTKRGYGEAMPGQSIRYDFKNIGNYSTVPLQSFYWRDNLPAEVRLEKIITGTWNHRLSYKITYRTNLDSEHRTLADNLNTAKNYVIDASSVALGLASNEYVVEFMFSFGQVPSGFSQVEAPAVYCKVAGGLTNGQQFVNNTDVGGLYNSNWIMAKDRWVTKVYNPVKPPTELPRTGY